MNAKGGRQELGRRTLRCTTRAPSEARSFIERVLREQCLDDLVPAAKLLASEAVTNAVVHARSSSVLTVTRENDVVHFALEDGGKAPIAERHNAPGHPTGGRGLFIIEQLAQRWGSDTLPSGSVVWFELATDAPAR